MIIPKIFTISENKTNLNKKFDNYGEGNILQIKYYILYIRVNEKNINKIKMNKMKGILLSIMKLEN